MEAVAVRSEPMDVAKRYVQLTRKKKELDREIAGVKKELEALEPEVLDLIEQEKLPSSFKLDGASVFTREDIWASPKDGDHAALALVLADIGLTEYLPRTVNSHSISAYVREHRNDEGEIVGLDPRLEAQLKISRKVKAVVNG